MWGCVFSVNGGGSCVGGCGGVACGGFSPEWTCVYTTIVMVVYMHTPKQTNPTHYMHTPKHPPKQTHTPNKHTPKQTHTQTNTPQLFNEARAKGLSINRNSVGHMIRAAVVLRNLDRAVDLVEQALAQVKWDQPAPAVLDSVVHLAERMGNKAVLTRLGNKFPGRLAGSFRKAAAWQEVGGFQLLGGTNFVEYREHIVRQKFDISKRPVRTKT